LCLLCLFVALLDVFPVPRFVEIRPKTEALGISFGRGKSSGRHCQYSETRRCNDQRQVLPASGDEQVARRDRAAVSTRARREEVSHKKAQKAQKKRLLTFVPFVPFCGSTRRIPSDTVRRNKAEIRSARH